MKAAVVLACALLVPGSVIAEDLTESSQQQATDPVAISTPVPGYPQEAISSGATGRVRVEFVVNREGTVETVRVLESSGSKALDDAAGNGLLRWKFEPARYADGTPTIAVMRTVVQFDL